METMETWAARQAAKSADLASGTEAAIAVNVRRIRRSRGVRVVCLECGRRWKTSNTLPECSGCGGSDVEPA